MNRRSLIALCVAVLFPSTALFSQDPNYLLRLGDCACPDGGQTAIRVILDFPSGEAMSGVSFGVCHDPAVLDIGCTGGIPNDCIENGVIVQGAALLATNGGTGAGFFAPATATSPQAGFTCGVVINLLGADSLAPTSDAEICVTSYDLVGFGQTDLTFCETGQPIVLLSLGLAAGGGILPSTEGCSVECVAPSIEPNLVQGSNPNAVLGAQTEIATTLEFQEETPAISGVSYGICHDPAIVDVGCTGGTPNDCIDNGVIVQGADVQATNGGQGAGFFAPATATSPSPGFTVGIVINLLGADSLPNTGTAELVVTTYDAIAEGTTSLDFCVTGDPLVLISMGIAGGGEVDPTNQSGSITVVTAPQFVRGDCNDDGGIDIADGIFFLNALFQDGPAGTCDAACDANGDGMLDSSDAVFIFLYVLLEGAPPPAPFPDCGIGDAEEECASYTGC